MMSMNEQLKEAFGQIRAEDQLKKKTKDKLPAGCSGLFVCTFLYLEDIGSILNQQQKSASISIHLWSWNLIDLIVCSQWKVNDQIQSKEVLNHIKGCTNKSENIYCYYIKAEEVENAHEAGFSCGKYKVFLEIQELDPRITAKEVKNMSMKEMRDLLKELSGTDQEKPEPHEKRKRHGKCK